jgi:hypothetical protein
MSRTLTALLCLTLAGTVAGAAGCAAGSDSPAPPASVGSPTPPPAPSGPPTPPASPAPPASPPPTTRPGPPDPWTLTTDGVGPYRLGQRLDSMPAGIFGESTPIDAAACPDLVSVQATGAYAGTLLLVARHNVLVEIFSAGGDPTVHTRWGDELGDAWARVEARHGRGSAAPGAWRTDPSGRRAYVIRVGDRVIMFSINPIRPRGIGGMTAGVTDHTLRSFDSGEIC